MHSMKFAVKEPLMGHDCSLLCSLQEAPVPGAPILDIIKVVDGSTSVLIGSIVYYNITVTNTGADATRITVTDTPDAGLIIGTLPSGETSGPFQIPNILLGGCLS